MSVRGLRCVYGPNGRDDFIGVECDVHALEVRPGYVLDVWLPTGGAMGRVLGFTEEMVCALREYGHYAQRSEESALADKAIAIIESLLGAGHSTKRGGDTEGSQEQEAQ